MVNRPSVASASRRTNRRDSRSSGPTTRAVVGRVGKSRGWPTPTKAQFLHEAGPDGAWCVGSPETVARKIVAILPALGASRFDLKYGIVGLSHMAVVDCIELYGNHVIPRARELLADAAELASTEK